jgi:xanthine/uracil permease
MERAMTSTSKARAALVALAFCLSPFTAATAAEKWDLYVYNAVSTVAAVKGMNTVIEQIEKKPAANWPSVFGGLLLMIAGGLIMSVSAFWSGQIIGRLVAGTGAVIIIINVQVTKMATDWFADREIASAMAIFVNSWPTGLALH